jgi:hypothetical protein
MTAHAAIYLQDQWLSVIFQNSAAIPWLCVTDAAPFVLLPRMSSEISPGRL